MYHFLYHSAYQFKRWSPVLCRASRLRVCRHLAGAELPVSEISKMFHFPFVEWSARACVNMESPLNSFRPLVPPGNKHRRCHHFLPRQRRTGTGSHRNLDQSVNRTGTAIWTQRPHKKASCSRSSSLATIIAAGRSSENRSRMPAMAAKGKRCVSILVNTKDIVLLTLFLETLPPRPQQPPRSRASLRRSPRRRGAAGQHLPAVRLPRSPARACQGCSAGPCRPLSG